MKKIEIEKWGCTVSIGTDILEKFAVNIKHKNSLFLVADKEVYKIYRKKITEVFGKNLKILLLPAGEKTKQNSYLSKSMIFC